MSKAPKPTFSQALQPPQAEPMPAATVAKVSDGRVNTTLRISPEGLEALKIVAAKQRVRVNDLLLEGAEHVLGLHGQKLQLRK